MTDQSPSLELFPTTQLTSTDSAITVPCEPITDGIAITPFLDLGDGAYQLGGGFTITHTTSGRLFTAGQACIECARSAARQLAAMDVNWTTIDPTSADTMRASLGDDLIAAGKILHRFSKCTQQVCQIDDDGKFEVCEACGFTGNHAPYCISVVLPQVAELNAASEAGAR